MARLLVNRVGSRILNVERVVLLRLSSDVKHLNLVVHVAMHSNMLPRDYFNSFVQCCAVIGVFYELQKLLHFEFIVGQVFFCV